MDGFDRTGKPGASATGHRQGCARPSDCPTSAWTQTKEIFEAARIKPAVVHVESHPYLPQWDLLDYCRKNGIVLQAFAALGHSSEPKLLEDPVITAIAKRVNKTPAQVLLAWAIQRGTALLTTSKTPSRIKENFEISALPPRMADIAPRSSGKENHLKM